MTEPGSTPLLDVRGLGKRFGGFVALEGFDVRLGAGERLGLIGPNGSGKSTCVNCISGSYPSHAGTVLLNGASLDGLMPHQRAHKGLVRSFQLPRPFHSLSVADNLRVPLLYTVGRHHRGLGHGDNHERRCEEILLQVGLMDKAKRLPRDLTQVEMRKLELARAMAAEPRLLIADEAMAGLSHSEVDDILELLLALNAKGVTIILIEHIMRAVMSFSQRLIVLVSGRKIADGDPQDVIRHPQVEQAYLGQ